MTESRKVGSTVGALVVTHGNLARELVDAAKKIVGESRRLRAVCIDWDQDVVSAQATIQTAIEGLGTTGGVLVLTDMFGGTPTNLSLSFLDPGQVEIVTGVNLPMLVKLLDLGDETSLADIVRQVTHKGQQSIQSASEILDPKAAKRSSRG